MQLALCMHPVVGRVCIQHVSKTEMIDIGVKVRISEVKSPLKVHNGTGLIHLVRIREVSGLEG